MKWDAMTEPEIYASLTEILQEVFMRDDISVSPSLSAKDVEGWDSIKQIEIIIAAEQRFSIKFTTRELDRLENVGDLVSIIQAKAP
jgi:acyl carrier protein